MVIQKKKTSLLIENDFLATFFYQHEVRISIFLITFVLSDATISLLIHLLFAVFNNDIKQVKGTTYICFPLFLLIHTNNW